MQGRGKIEGALGRECINLDARESEGLGVCC